MFSLTDPFFWLSLIGIFISFFITFYIPGRVILGNLKIEHKYALPVITFVVGLTLWAWQGYILALLNLRILSYLYLIIFVGIYIYKKYYRDISFSLNLFKKIDVIVLIIAIFGIAAQILPYLHMGQKTDEGVILKQYSIDHVWHAGITLDLVDHFPPNEPGMSGIVLIDYHYWFNLITADLIRVFHLPLMPTQFIGIYPLASVLLLFVGYYFAKLIYDNKLFIRLFLFFLFFSGDASMWLTLFLQQKFNLSFASLINNGTKFIDTPAFAYSMIVGLTAFYLIFQEKKKISKKIIIISALLFGSLFEFKIYTGMVFMFGFAALASFALLKKRFDIVLTFILASLFGAFVFFPNVSSSSGLIFLPFEVPRDFITQRTLGFYDWELRWRIYQDHHNYLRIIQYGIYMSGIYLFVQFGLQLIGLIPWKKTLQILSLYRTIPLYMIVISGFILGLFFYQTVGGANIWEFLLPAGFILSLLTALTITTILNGKNKIVRLFVIAIIIIFVIPRWGATAYEDLHKEFLSGFHGISNEEYASYAYLEKNVPKNTIVMVVNHAGHVDLVSHIKIFSGVQLYLSGEGTRQTLTPEILKRRNLLTAVKGEYNENNFAILNSEKVKYLYYYGEIPQNMINRKGLTVVFKNKEATIVRID